MGMDKKKEEKRKYFIERGKIMKLNFNLVSVGILMSNGKNKNQSYNGNYQTTLDSFINVNDINQPLCH